MPSAQKAFCRHHGCAQLTTKGFCDEHKKQRNSSGYGRAKTKERGYGGYWRKLREEALRRDKYMCQVCKRYMRHTPATEVDHIVNKASGGGDEMSNLQAICQRCHRVKTQRESQLGG